MSPFLSRFTITFCSLLSITSLALGQKASIEASLKGADGHLPKNAQIRIESLDKKTKAIVVTPDAHGHVVVSSLEGGQYRVTAIVGGKTTSSQVIKVAANKSATATFDPTNTSGTRGARLGR